MHLFTLWEPSSSFLKQLSNIDNWIASLILGHAINRTTDDIQSLTKNMKIILV